MSSQTTHKTLYGVHAKANRLVPIGGFAIIALLPMVVPQIALGVHSPKEWYEQSPLDDGDGDKIEDFLTLNRVGQDPVDVIICFKDDCHPPDRMAELAQLGTIGYQSTVVASVQVSGIQVADLINIVAKWPEVGYIHMNHVIEEHMTSAGQNLKAHASGLYSPNTAEDAGFDGTGITIAVLDTGVDDPGGPGTTHNHLPAAVGGLTMALPCDALGNCTLTMGNPDDQRGHGTAVAGCALGRGAPGNVDRGMAPGANLFDCRITAPGTGGSTTSANIQQVVDWLTWFGNTVVPPVRVANLSFGNMCQSAGSALTASLEALVASGVAVTVSAGNHDSCAVIPIPGGTCTGGIGHIAVTSRAITVAAASDQNTVDPGRADDVIANYSRVGPGIGLSPKPDITAYGNQCPISCAAPGSCTGPSTVVIAAPAKDSATGYIGFGGTSAASPMVAGAAALIIERNPSITPAAVKQLLMDNAEDRGTAGWDATWGAGLMDLGPIFGNPPGPCDLRVKSVTYSPSTVQCFSPVTISVEVENVGAGPVTNFSVDWERWYFGPNSAPAQRFPIGGGPQVNTAGPLNPGATRTFMRTWTPGISDGLPLSQHSCFWGIVHASCDTNAGNNERNRNVTIIGVNNYSCRVPGAAQTEEATVSFEGGGCGDPQAGSCCEAQEGPGCADEICCQAVCEFDSFCCQFTWDGNCVLLAAQFPEECGCEPEFLVNFPFRVGHNNPFPQGILLALDNPDQENWYAELEYQGQADPGGLFVVVDNQDCPVWVNLRAQPLNPQFTPAIPLRVQAFDELGFLLGDMEALVDVNDCGPCQLHGDVFPTPAGNCTIDVDDILEVLRGFADGPATRPWADIFPCGGNQAIDVDDILSVLRAFAGNYDCPHPCPP